MDNFEMVMNLIEEIGEGEKELEDIIRFGGMNVPSHMAFDQFEDCFGNVCENSYLVYEWQNATADRDMFTEEQCKEIEEAWGYAYQNILDYDDMYDITKDWAWR